MIKYNVCTFKLFYLCIKILFRSSTQVGNLERELKQCKSQMAEQHKTLIEYSSRMDEYDKKNEETNRKFSTLLQVCVKPFKPFIYLFFCFLNY